MLVPLTGALARTILSGSRRIILRKSSQQFHKKRCSGRSVRTGHYSGKPQDVCHSTHQTVNDRRFQLMFNPLLTGLLNRLGGMFGRVFDNSATVRV